MPGSWPQGDFPSLNILDYVETSPATRRYNCIAWAANNDARWWWPDAFNNGYWPPNVPREETIDAFVRAYGTLGYVRCNDAALEPGYEKIAIFATYSMGVHTPTHAAKQLADGSWTSKLGTCEDITHNTLDCLAGPRYGAAAFFLKRRR